MILLCELCRCIIRVAGTLWAALEYNLAGRQSRPQQSQLYYRRMMLNNRRDFFSQCTGFVLRVRKLLTFEYFVYLPYFMFYILGKKKYVRANKVIRDFLTYWCNVLCLFIKSFGSEWRQHCLRVCSSLFHSHCNKARLVLKAFFTSHHIIMIVIKMHRNIVWSRFVTLRIKQATAVVLEAKTWQWNWIIYHLRTCICSLADLISIFC